MSLRPASHEAGTPYPEVTGLFCRIPSQTLSPTRLGLLSQGHLCQFSVRTHALTLANFSRAPGIGRSRPKAAYSHLPSVLTITVLPEVQRLTRATTPVHLARCVIDKTETRMVQEY